MNDGGQVPTAYERRGVRRSEISHGQAPSIETDRLGCGGVRGIDQLGIGFAGCRATYAAVRLLRIRLIFCTSLLRRMLVIVTPERKAMA